MYVEFLAPSLAFSKKSIGGTIDILIMMIMKKTKFSEQKIFVSLIVLMQC